MNQVQTVYDGYQKQKYQNTKVDASKECVCALRSAAGALIRLYMVIHVLRDLDSDPVTLENLTAVSSHNRMF